jgi:hypothetical protein
VFLLPEARGAFMSARLLSGGSGSDLFSYSPGKGRVGSGSGRAGGALSLDDLGSGILAYPIHTTKRLLRKKSDTVQMHLSASAVNVPWLENQPFTPRLGFWW